MKLELHQFDPISRLDGYRPNVGIIIINNDAKVFWARRITGDGWQFPQGGLKANESVVEGMYRELLEETGLQANDVEVIAHTKDWLKYDLPKRYLRRNHSRQPNRFKAADNSSKGERGNEQQAVSFKGQKQIWFLVKLVEPNVEPDLAYADKPEFDDWRWVNYWYALDNIVSFKRDVYQTALSELEPYV